MKKTVLIYGSTGYFGTYYVKHLKENKLFNVIINYDRINDKTSINLQNVDAVLYLATRQQTEKNKPDFFTVNCQFPIKLAKQCAKKKIQFIYFSTDMVFTSNNKSNNVKSSVNPKTFYGLSKAFTENSIKKHKTSCIIRTSLLYGYKNLNKNNLLNLVRNNLKENKKTELYDDAFIRPTHVKDLSNCVDYIIDNKKCGIFHALNETAISRFEFAKMFLQSQNIDHEDKLVPIKTPENSDIEKSILIKCSTEVNKFFVSDVMENIIDET